ncbi:MAG: beta galactosidase jelly roll domain-containing protein, partial [Prevotellaceae bacterium]|nr:beta galactosidase jelly roll domain-containing protein [Prevotellaceae bacterium]
MTIKKHLFVLALGLLCASVSSQVSFGSPELINNGWKFIQSDVQKAQTPDFDDKKWQNVDLPHDWSVRNNLSPSLAAAQGFLPGGIGWYRKTLNVPADKKGEKVYLYFEGVYNRSEVFVNGQSVGKRPNGYVSFNYDITHLVKFGENNTVAVRVDHSKQADSRWYTGSGIYRNVWVVYANPVHIAEWG